MLLEVMRLINNHFAINKATGEFFFPPEHSEFKIKNGILKGVAHKPIVGSYFAITGSVLNNGIYLAADSKITLTEANNEEFNGTIYRLIVPKDFIDITERIKTFRESEDGKASGITSASFGIQSVSFATDSNGIRAGWQAVFRNELRAYRRMFPDISI